MDQRYFRIPIPGQFHVFALADCLSLLSILTACKKRYPKHFPCIFQSIKEGKHKRRSKYFYTYIFIQILSTNSKLKLFVILSPACCSLATTTLLPLSFDTQNSTSRFNHFLSYSDFFRLRFLSGILFVISRMQCWMVFSEKISIESGNETQRN